MPSKHNTRKRCTVCGRPYVIRRDGKIPAHPTERYNLAKVHDPQLRQALEDSGEKWCTGGERRGNPLEPRDGTHDSLKAVLQTLSDSTGLRIELDPHTGEPTVVDRDDLGQAAPSVVDYQRAVAEVEEARREIQRLQRVVGKLTAAAIASDADLQRRWVETIAGDA